MGKNVRTLPRRSLFKMLPEDLYPKSCAYCYFLSSFTSKHDHRISVLMLTFRNTGIFDTQLT